jgi:hypothetical protein
MSGDYGDVFEPIYSPRRVEFWLAHWEELDTLVHSPKSAAHIAEHLNREWWLIQSRYASCICKELHDADTLAVDPACAHMPGGGAARSMHTALCIFSDLRLAADELPPGWLATRQIWNQQMLPDRLVDSRLQVWRAQRNGIEREPVFARNVAIRRMAAKLGWSRDLERPAV